MAPLSPSLEFVPVIPHWASLVDRVLWLRVLMRHLPRLNLLMACILVHFRLWTTMTFQVLALFFIPNGSL